MQRRFRFRRVLKWTGTVACGLVLIAAGMSLKWLFSFSTGSLEPFWMISITGGGVYVWYSTLSLVPDNQSWALGVHSPTDYVWASLWPEFSWPTLMMGSTVWTAWIPLWLPFVVFAIPTVLLWRLDRRPAPGCCDCGYNLTGTTSGRCPECGAACGA